MHWTIIPPTLLIQHGSVVPTGWTGMVSDLNEKEWISNQCVNRKLCLSHLSFWKQSTAPWERPSVLSQWLSSHSSLLSNGAYPPSPACLANLSHRVSWQPSRGFPALVSTITFKCVVGGDAPLSVLLASNSEVCLGPREEPGSQSQSDPSGSCCPVPGGVL